MRVNASQDPGAKELYIQAVLRHLRDTWNIRALATLSDKDWSEINSMRAVWPAAKYQLCFWHALRAVKQRLAKKPEAPGSYNWHEANSEFSFVSSEFVPESQQSTPNLVSYVIAEIRFLITVSDSSAARSTKVSGRYSP